MPIRSSPRRAERHIEIVTLNRIADAVVDSAVELAVHGPDIATGRAQVAPHDSDGVAEVAVVPRRSAVVSAEAGRRDLKTGEVDLAVRSAEIDADHGIARDGICIYRKADYGPVPGRGAGHAPVALFRKPVSVRRSAW